MGLFDRFTNQKPKSENDVSASLSPFSISDTFWNAINNGIGASRIQAMSIPTIARARNLICSSVASLPIEQYIKLNYDERKKYILCPEVCNYDKCFFKCKDN